MAGSGAAVAVADDAGVLRRFERSWRRARRHGDAASLAAVTFPARRAFDPAATIAAARATGEDWFVFEKPAAAGAVVAGLGVAVAIESTGAGRIGDAAARWRTLVTRSVFDGPSGPVPGMGPVAAGGFAFAADGCSAAEWHGFSGGSLVVPRIAIARRGQDAFVTLTVTAGGDGPGPRELLDRVLSLDGEARLPEPVADPRSQRPVTSVLAPAHYLAAVEHAVRRIGAGEFDKIVLARAVETAVALPYRPEALLGAMRLGYPDCHLCVVARGDAAFVAASPELLIRRDGQRASTVALAGSARRGADSATDEHLGHALLAAAKEGREHAIVVERIVRALGPHAVWVAAADRPQLARIANIQHLATPIRAQLRGHRPVLDLVAALHPTPAVGGEPPAAAAAIAGLEGLDRGWYAGPLGWTDTNEDGEFVVGLRSALVRGRQARCYAGVGVVAGSDPAAELAETELKLDALLPLLSR